MPAGLSVTDSCVSNPTVYPARSAELEQLEKDDQADRSGDLSSLDWNKIHARDLQRRVRVAAIFAEGCLRSPSDYTRAALIFQHGDSADHFYQTFLWAQTAIRLSGELGQSLVSARSMAAVGLDRYLVNTGRKQLFGTQLSQQQSGVWCIEPIEPSFPAAERFKYLSMSARDYVVFFMKFYRAKQKPEDVLVCDHSLRPSPAGTVLGFW